jgi:hypothetical protein
MATVDSVFNVVEIDASAPCCHPNGCAQHDDVVIVAAAFIRQARRGEGGPTATLGQRHRLSEAKRSEPGR